MATYNGERFLGEQLNSLLQQTILPQELVIGDDQSSDRTIEILEAFSATAPFPVHIYRNETRLGYRANFMATGARCKSDLIFFCDQDDIWLPNKIERMKQCFAKESVFAAYHNAQAVDELGKSLFSVYDGDIERRLISDSGPEPFHHSQGFTQAYRSELHVYDDLWRFSRDHIFPDELLAHDQWFMFLAMLLGQVCYVDEDLVKYRQHGQNVFGMQEPRGTFGRESGLWNRFFLAADPNGARGPAAASRAAIAMKIADRAAPNVRERVRQMGRQYEELAKVLELWSCGVGDGNPLARFTALFGNVKRGAYWGGFRWRFRSSWLIGDVARALVGSRRSVKRSARQEPSCS